MKKSAIYIVRSDNTPSKLCQQTTKYKRANFHISVTRLSNCKEFRSFQLRYQISFSSVEFISRSFQLALNVGKSAVNNHLNWQRLRHAPKWHNLPNKKVASGPPQERPLPLSKKLHNLVRLNSACTCKLFFPVSKRRIVNNDQPAFVKATKSVAVKGFSKETSNSDIPIQRINMVSYILNQLRLTCYHSCGLATAEPAVSVRSLRDEFISKVVGNTLPRLGAFEEIQVQFPPTIRTSLLNSNQLDPFSIDMQRLRDVLSQLFFESRHLSHCLRSHSVHIFHWKCGIL